MKSIKNLREQYDLITEKEEHDMNKLSQLVRAGLFDAKKLSALKRAMDKPADKMTAQEKRMMISLLDALMAEVLTDKQVYRKVKQDVMKEAADWEDKEHLSGPDPKIKRFGFPKQKDVPTVLLLKRKAIRVYPDGQKVALYYAQAIDKYVSIPYNEIGIGLSENLSVEEGWLSAIGGVMLGGNSDSGETKNSKVADDTPKFEKSKPSKIKATIVKPVKTGNASVRAERERQANARAIKANKPAPALKESLDLDGNLFQLNSKVVPKVKALYESLNKKNKKTMVGMMNESVESLEKVISFAVRQ